MRSELREHAERLECSGQWAEAGELRATIADECGDPPTFVRYARALAAGWPADDAERILKPTLTKAPEASVVHFSLRLLFEDLLAAPPI